MENCLGVGVNVGLAQSGFATYQEMYPRDRAFWLTDGTDLELCYFHSFQAICVSFLEHLITERWSFVWDLLCALCGMDCDGTDYDKKKRKCEQFAAMTWLWGGHHGWYRVAYIYIVAARKKTVIYKDGVLTYRVDPYSSNEFIVCCLWWVWIKEMKGWKKEKKRVRQHLWLFN